MCEKKLRLDPTQTLHQRKFFKKASVQGQEATFEKKMSSESKFFKIGAVLLQKLCFPKSALVHQKFCLTQLLPKLAF